MHRRSVWAIAVAAIVIFAASAFAGAQPAATDAVFARALKLESDGKMKDVLQEYDAIVRANSGKNARIAGEALYRRGEFAWKRFGKTEADRKQGLDEALRSWKQLRDSHADTDAARRLTTPSADYPKGALAALDDVIDERNSHELNYKVIDSLVSITGKVPSFSYGFALILLAFIVKALLLPLTKRQYGSMREMQKMQPLIKDLQKRYKGKELQEKQMELYKEHNVNPFAGCLPSLLQLPFLFWIFAAIREYEIAFGRGTFLWIGSPLADRNPSIFGRNLASPDVPLLTMYVITNYITMRMTPAQDPQQQEQQKFMALMTSGMFFYMFLINKWSSAFVLYWFALNLLSIWQQYVYVYQPHRERQLAAAASGESAVPDTNGAAPSTSRNGSATDAETPPVVAARGQATRVRPRKKKK